MDNWTAGDYGGAFAGVVGAVAAVSKGLAWLLNWKGERETRRDKQLREWEASLTKREKAQREQLEQRFVALEQKDSAKGKAIVALAGQLIEVSIELKRFDPKSPVLERAIAALRQVLPEDLQFTPAMHAAVAGLDAMGD